MTRKPVVHKPIEIAVSGWLNDLKLATVSANEPQADIEARIAVMTNAIIHEFPDASLFNKETLFAISKQNRFFPGLADLSKQLGEWRDKNRPRAFVPPTTLDEADMTREERMNVIVWLQHHAANDLSERDMTTRLGVIRRYAPKGYRWLLAQRTEAAMYAADIAVRLRWDDEVRQPPTEEERDAVSEIVRQRFPTAQQATDLRADDGRVSVSPSPVAAPVRPAPIVMPDGRAAGALSAEHLRAYREANPTLREVQEQEDANRVVREGRLPWWDEDAV